MSVPRTETDDGAPPMRPYKRVVVSVLPPRSWRLCPRQTESAAVASELHECLRSPYRYVPAPEIGDDLVMLAPDALAVLALVCEKRRLFLFDRRRDVHEVGGI